MANQDWADLFRDKLKVKEIARQENKKNFQIYQQLVFKLFETIEGKIKKIDTIQIQRYLASQSEITPFQIKTLKLQCFEKYLEFVPEGINLDTSKGTIRLRHTCGTLSQFIYLHLTVNPHATQPYPENLHWVINEEGATTFDELPPFDDAALERLIELTFLE